MLERRPSSTWRAAAGKSREGTPGARRLRSRGTWCPRSPQRRPGRVLSTARAENWLPFTLRAPAGWAGESLGIFTDDSPNESYLGTFELIDSAAVRAVLPVAAEEVIAFARKHLMVESVIKGVRRQERWSIPLVAIREAVVNAIVHADYAQQGSPIRLAVFDDRIEIENPGLLLFGLTIDDLQQGVSKLRNRVIGRVFHELRLIEHWGSGIQRMNTACEEAGLPKPKLEELGSHFRVTIFSRRVAEPRVDAIDEKILSVLRKKGATGTGAIAKLVGLSARATLTRLGELKARGIVVELGTGPHDPKRQYLLAE